MAGLFIRDESVNELAVEATRLTGAASKTEAVRAALQAAIRAAKDQTPLAERLKAAQELAAQIGTLNPEFDEKLFMDELWGGH